MTLAVNFEVINAYHVFWSWSAVVDKLHLWRLVTVFCYAGPFHLSTVITVYLLYQFSKQYEGSGPFNTGGGGGTADYVFCLMVGAAIILLTFPLLRGTFPLAPVFCQNLVFYVLYVWSKRNPTAQANIWGFPIKGVYLPFAYLALTVFMGNPYYGMLHGMVVGHLYYFLVDVVPVVYGKDVLTTPQFLINYFGIGEYRPGIPPVAQAQPGGGGGRDGAHDWGGGGRALGGN